MVRSFVLLVLLLATYLPAHAAAPVKARPLSGIGVLTVRSGGADLVLYREPGLGRVSELPSAKLPVIFPPPGPDSGRHHALVLSLRPGWLRIIRDDRESDGWLERRRGDLFQTWEQFLPGRSCSLLAGLRQDSYQMRRDPSSGAETVSSVERGDPLLIGMVAGDWISVRDGRGNDGWLRWRDDNARLMITVTGGD